MARAILVIGEPGTGKSRAIKDLNPKQTIIIKPNKKELPFKGSAVNYKNGSNMVVTTSLPQVGKLLMDINTKFKGVKNVIIEDITHFFTKRTVDERKVTGFGKWMELAASIKQNIIDKEAILRDDLTLFVIGHVAEKKDKSGNPELSLHTPGKMLDNNIMIPSYFTYMFHTDLIENSDGTMQYRFQTNRTSFKVAKTPEGMFPLYIANNYELIKRYITAYQTDSEVDLTGIDEDINVSQETIKYTVPEVEAPAKSSSEDPEVEDSVEVDDGLSGEDSLDVSDNDEGEEPTSEEKSEKKTSPKEDDLSI